MLSFLGPAWKRRRRVSSLVILRSGFWARTASDLMADAAISAAAGQLRAETGPRGLRHPRLWAGLRRCVRLAHDRGYVDGEHVLGCAFILRAEEIQAIYDNGCFDQPWLEGSRLGDDQIMRLMTVAAGYKLADFGGPTDPLALKWKGLPADPMQLLASGKLVTHSVRAWGDLTERQIREVFAAARVSTRVN